MLSIFFSRQVSLEAVNLSHNQRLVMHVSPIIQSLRASPSFSQVIKEVELCGVEWSLQESKDLLFPILKDAQSLESFKISSTNLFKPEFIQAIMEDEMSEKIIKVLYFEGELKLLDDFESWEIQSESFSKLLEFIGNL